METASTTTFKVKVMDHSPPSSRPPLIALLVLLSPFHFVFTGAPTEGSSVQTTSTNACNHSLFLRGRRRRRLLLFTELRHTKTAKTASVATKGAENVPVFIVPYVLCIHIHQSTVYLCICFEQEDFVEKISAGQGEQEKKTEK